MLLPRTLQTMRRRRRRIAGCVMGGDWKTPLVYFEKKKY